MQAHIVRRQFLAGTRMGHFHLAAIIWMKIIFSLQTIDHVAVAVRMSWLVPSTSSRGISSTADHNSSEGPHQTTDNIEEIAVARTGAACGLTPGLIFRNCSEEWRKTKAKSSREVTEPQHGICVICHESMDPRTEEPCIMVQCGHTFHTECIATNRITYKRLNCPTCRKPVGFERELREFLQFGNQNGTSSSSSSGSSFPGSTFIFGSCGGRTATSSSGDVRPPSATASRRWSTSRDEPLLSPSSNNNRSPSTAPSPQTSPPASTRGTGDAPERGRYRRVSPTDGGHRHSRHDILPVQVSDDGHQMAVNMPPLPGYRVPRRSPGPPLDYDPAVENPDYRCEDGSCGIYDCCFCIACGAIGSSIACCWEPVAALCDDSLGLLHLRGSGLRAVGSYFHAEFPCTRWLRVGRSALGCGMMFTFSGQALVGLLFLTVLFTGTGCPSDKHAVFPCPSSLHEGLVHGRHNKTATKPEPRKEDVVEHPERRRGLLRAGRLSNRATADADAFHLPPWSSRTSEFSGSTPYPTDVSPAGVLSREKQGGLSPQQAVTVRQLEEMDLLAHEQEDISHSYASKGVPEEARRWKPRSGVADGSSAREFFPRHRANADAPSWASYYTSNADLDMNSESRPVGLRGFSAARRRSQRVPPLGGWQPRQTPEEMKK
ncbi:unnamed protein product [Amoebophrya sp. A120]|nr:unnamed protein product [Amoebophrya sp. A120]|eukprot:GSA120T00006299001.1